MCLTHFLFRFELFKDNNSSWITEKRLKYLLESLLSSKLLLALSSLAQPHNDCSQTRAPISRVETEWMLCEFVSAFWMLFARRKQRPQLQQHYLEPLEIELNIKTDSSWSFKLVKNEYIRGMLKRGSKNLAPFRNILNVCSLCIWKYICGSGAWPGIWAANDCCCACCWCCCCGDMPYMFGGMHGCWFGKPSGFIAPGHNICWCGKEATGELIGMVGGTVFGIILNEFWFMTFWTLENFVCVFICVSLGLLLLLWFGLRAPFVDELDTDNMDDDETDEDGELLFTTTGGVLLLLLLASEEFDKFSLFIILSISWAFWLFIALQLLLLVLLWEDGDETDANEPKRTESNISTPNSLLLLLLFARFLAFKSLFPLMRLSIEKPEARLAFEVFIFVVCLFISLFNSFDSDIEAIRLLFLKLLFFLKSLLTFRRFKNLKIKEQNVLVSYQLNWKKKEQIFFLIKNINDKLITKNIFIWNEEKPIMK